MVHNQRVPVTIRSPALRSQYWRSTKDIDIWLTALRHGLLLHVQGDEIGLVGGPIHQRPDYFRHQHRPPFITTTTSFSSTFSDEPLLEGFTAAIYITPAYVIVPRSTTQTATTLVAWQIELVGVCAGSEFPRLSWSCCFYLDVKRGPNFLLMHFPGIRQTLLQSQPNL